MTDIGTFFTDLFRPLGLWGGLICIFILFYIDAIIFPTVPELFTVIIFTGTDVVEPVVFGAAILLVIVIAEVAGVITLYLVVKKARLPERIRKIVKRYQDLLICPDERMILINRLAPVLPFLGAFIVLAGWDLKKSLYYVVIGSVVKYGILLAVCAVFVVTLTKEMAQTITITMVVIFIALSMIVTYYRKRRMKYAGRPT